MESVPRLSQQLLGQLVSVALTALLLPLAASAQSPVPALPSLRDPLKLTTVIDQELSGLSALAAADSAAYRLLQERTDEFIRLRRHKLRSDVEKAWIAACFDNEAHNPYCEFAVKRREAPSLDVGDSPRELSKREARAELSRVEAILKRSDSDRSAQLAELEKLPQWLFNRTLKGFPDWTPLKPLADQAMVRGSKPTENCPPVAVTLALAQKVEEFFPAQEMRSTAQALYARALECGDADPASHALLGPRRARKRATSSGSPLSPYRFRLALLQIWDGHCDQAEPHLTLLGSEADGDFVMRSIYWRAECAARTGNKKLRERLEDELKERYPLSYHGLALVRGSPAGELAKLKSKEEAVMLRSVQQPGINVLADIVELLTQMKAGDLAREVLAVAVERAEDAETEFRLYLAVLYMRIGDFVGQFRQMADVFRDHPEAISKPILEAFYPLRKTEILKKYGQQVDPLLVAALIRQESAFNERARSPAGALGLMQLMPRTARLFERLSRFALFKPDVNVRVGVRYFYRLLSRYNSDAELALAAYNAGSERVDQWVTRYPTSNRMLFLDLIPFKETRDYVALIGRNYFWYVGLYELETNSKIQPAMFTAFQREAVAPAKF